jgi:hypothetical protein
VWRFEVLDGDVGGVGGDHHVVQAVGRRLGDVGAARGEPGGDVVEMLAPGDASRVGLGR